MFYPAGSSARDRARFTAVISDCFVSGLGRSSIPFEVPRMPDWSTKTVVPSSGDVVHDASGTVSLPLVEGMATTATSTASRRRHRPPSRGGQLARSRGPAHATVRNPAASSHWAHRSSSAKSGVTTSAARVTSIASRMSTPWWQPSDRSLTPLRPSHRRRTPRWIRRVRKPR
jgi:hypothetical protein